MRDHLHHKRRVQTAETTRTRHVHEWNSGRGLACQGLKSRISANGGPVGRQRVEQHVDIGAVAIAAVKRIGQYLADHLIVLSARNRVVVRLDRSMPNGGELLRRRHHDRGGRRSVSTTATLSRNRRALKELGVAVRCVGARRR